MKQYIFDGTKYLVERPGIVIKFDNVDEAIEYAQEHKFCKLYKVETKQIG